MSTIYSIYLFLLPPAPPVFLPLPHKFMIYYSLIILYNYVYVCIYMIMIYISLYVIYAIYRYIIIYDGPYKLIYVNVWFHWWNCFGGVALLEDACCWEWTFRFQNPTPPIVYSLCLVLVDSDASSQLLLQLPWLPASCHSHHHFGHGL